MFHGRIGPTHRDRLLLVVELRISKELMTFEDGDHLDRIRTDAVDDTIGSLENLSYIGTIELRHDTAALRVYGHEFSSRIEAGNPPASGHRVIVADVAPDLL
jgi:hypothetical protein